MRRTPPIFLSLSVLFLFGILASALSAQSRGRIKPNLRNPDQLDSEEGKRVIAQFRQTQLDGDFLFDVVLIHEPNRGESREFRGQLTGHYDKGMRTRIDFAPRQVEDAPLRFLQWSGPQPRLWKFAPQSDADTVEAIEGEALHAPLLPGIVYTPYDLQMPFFHWADFAYEGSRRLKGRAVHYFLLYPPELDARYAHIGAVRVAIDADFNVAVRAETLDLDGNALRRLEVRSVKKIDEQWIVSRIDLIDLQSRDRTQLRVTAARVGLLLPSILFTPEGLREDLPSIPLTEL